MKNIAKVFCVSLVLVLASCGGNVSKSPKKAVGGQGQPCNSDGTCAPMLTCIDDTCQVAPDNNTNVMPNNTNVTPNNLNVTPNNLNVMDPFCGNGVREAAEACDGADLAGESCLTLGYDGGQLQCDFSCGFFDDSNCFTESGNVCGNFVVEPPEVCDADDLRGETCRSLGYAGGELYCGPDCLDYDVNDCFDAACGNGVIEGGEFCDSTNVNGQSCESLGYDGGELRCNSACADYNVTGCWRCGNGVLEPGEECDGNDFGGATCASLGLGSGQLTCRNTCTISEAGCVSTPLQCGLPASCTVNDPAACVCEGCTNNGMCADDDCVCPDCANDTSVCPDNVCNNNGVCDPFNESCRCADCAAHPRCTP